MALLGLSALGVVFGDIGTSPLYTLKVVMSLSGGQTDSATILGLLSLLFWTLIIVTSIKYVFFAMKIDNNGEGGILALMAMLGVKRKKVPLVTAAGLFGAALLYGDGAITPAISVLSALEGLNIIVPQAGHFVLPTTVLILLCLFFFQSKGTARIGKTFGPIMAIWFIAIALLGVRGIIQHPSVLVALNPLYGLNFLISDGFASFLVLGGVFLCVTGAEALYADMGHFGVRPIRLMWFWMVFPCLLLNYAGQAALVLAGANISDNIFYRLCPSPLLIPLVILATSATIIASQAVITGAFSLTRQAMQLGWLPRLRIKQTSAEGYGQIYVSTVNWLLMVVTIGLVLSFQSSDNLASAYGIAVSLTMLLTSILLFIAMRRIWNWSLWASALVAGIFLVIDTSFVLANLVKLSNGGYIPLLLAAIIFSIMLIWHRGSALVASKVSERMLPAAAFLAKLREKNLPRVPGTAIFLTRTLQDVPPVMRWHVRRNHSLHENLFVLNIMVTTTPWVEAKNRLEVKEVAPHFWRASAHYGFMEKPDIPQLLHRAVKQQKLSLDLDDATYYLGHETIVTHEGSPWYTRWQNRLFAILVRNSTHVTDVFHLPRDQVVEIGRQVTL
ncbi:MAG: potassium transporter Kup [Enterobacteriaceae bacterium]